MKQLIPSGFYGVDESDRKRSPEVNKAIRFLLYTMYQNLQEISSYRSLYNLIEKWFDRDILVWGETVFPWCSVRFGGPPPSP